MAQEPCPNCGRRRRTVRAACMFEAAIQVANDRENLGDVSPADLELVDVDEFWERQGRVVDWVEDSLRAARRELAQKAKGP